MANVVDDMTERLLADAGIGPRMRVVDIGCGFGDVTRMLARRVGAGGEVFGVDHDASALEAARQRVSDLGLVNVHFVQGDFDTPLPGHGTFDAVVGRRVLMYQPDQVTAVKKLVPALRPGGLVVFQEHDSVPVNDERFDLPLHDRVRSIIWETVKREGANPHTGFDLYGVLTDAGLTVEQVRAESNLQTPDYQHPVEFIMRAMQPRMMQQGVIQEGDIPVDGLDRLLIEERQRAGVRTQVWEMVFLAWARKTA